MKAVAHTAYDGNGAPCSKRMDMAACVRIVNAGMLKSQLWVFWTSKLSKFAGFQQNESQIACQGRAQVV
jgi:hypothetical protein